MIRNDSEETRKQKEVLIEDLENQISYLRTHGSHLIHLWDLKDAHRALDRMKVEGFDDVISKH